MPLIRTSVKGEPVKLFTLPPADDTRAKRWERFIASDNIFGLDVETTAIDEDMGAFEPSMRLRMVQFGTRTEAWALDAADPFWRPRIEKILSDGTIRYVSHTNYDPLWVLREFEIDLAERIIDTHCMASILWPGPTVNKQLKPLCDKFIDTGLSVAEEMLIARFKELAPKGEKVGKKLKAWGFTHIPLDDPAFCTYGGLDAVYVRRLLDELNRLLRKKKQSKLSQREQRIHRMMTRTQFRGQLVDKAYTTRVLREIESEYKTADEFLTDTFGFSPRSPRRGEWLEEKGVRFFAHTPTGRPKLDAENIELLAQRYTDHEELGPIFAGMHTLSSRQNVLNNLKGVLAAADPEGFVHPKINTQQAVTGRMSIVRPAMQTFKKTDARLRGCFIARPGHIFVGADYDSQETRIAAAFSKDEALLKIVNQGLNQHDLTAEMIFGKNFTKEHRAIAKTLNFAQQYGAGPKKIAAQLGISVGEAKELWLAWRRAYKGLVAWTDHLQQFTIVRNPWGREIPADRYRRYANGNYAIQSTGREVLGDALIRLEECGLGKYVWLPIHDEIILEVPEDLAERAARVLVKKMKAEVQGIPLTATPKILGTRWNGEDK